jgi:MoxR-like ATPase
MQEDLTFTNRVNLEELHLMVNSIRNEIGRFIIGQQKMIDYLLMAILADGHVLLEGVPGVAKTMTAKLMAKCISAKFSRLQFTPDLMPSDVLGTSVFNMTKSEFVFNPGPIFANIILIDEINRAPAKTQSALFEVMEERQVTIDGVSYLMEKPFIVFATQNPIDMEGTYRLPEAQLDRFIFKFVVNYPTLEEEVMILTNHHHNKGVSEINQINSILSIEKLIEYQAKVKMIFIDEPLRKYIAQIIQKTRNHSSLFLGASPRAGINLMNASKALAAIEGRDFVKPEDIKEVAFPVLRHRIILSPEKEMEGVSAEEVIKDLLNSIEIPR